MKTTKPCRIVNVGKRRDGGLRYWCLEHKADATAKYGRRARKCRYAHVTPLLSSEILSLDLSSYKGGIAIWGSAPAVYDTTRLPLEHGIHVHARQSPGSEDKEIDDTYRAVAISAPPFHDGSLLISELDAIYFMVTSIFGYEIKYIECSACGHPHLDRDWFSVHSHQRHLCAGCGKHFRDSERAIGNPIAKVVQMFKSTQHGTKPAKKRIAFKQSDFPGGVQIWGSNRAIVWTGGRSEEEGIHLHAYNEKGKRVCDDTYASIDIDGVKLDADMVRIFMAQSALPHIIGRVGTYNCPKCRQPHFDTQEHAFTAHNTHACEKCGLEFLSKGKMRKTISNPVVDVFDNLGRTAPRLPQKHKSGLLPETL